MAPVQQQPGLLWVRSSYRCTIQSSPQPSEYLMMCIHSAKSHLSCYTIMQSHYLQNMGWVGIRAVRWQRADWCHLVNFSTFHPFQSLSSHRLCRFTLWHPPTTQCHHLNPHPTTTVRATTTVTFPAHSKSNARYHREIMCSPCPHGARRATHCV